MRNASVKYLLYLSEIGFSYIFHTHCALKSIQVAKIRLGYRFQHKQKQEKGRNMQHLR